MKASKERMDRVETAIAEAFKNLAVAQEILDRADQKQKQINDDDQQ